MQLTNIGLICSLGNVQPVLSALNQWKDGLEKIQSSVMCPFSDTLLAASLVFRH